jgi:hypothetical protein
MRLLTLDYTRCHHTYAVLRHQLHADSGAGVGALEIIDQLGEIFDGVDVVVRGGRNEAHARGGSTRARNVALDLQDGRGCMGMDA